jgi:biopolymer transport protein TolR
MSFGRLERSNSAQPMGDINMTPLIDVMLVLVVILLVTAPLLASSVRLDLPKTDAAAPSEAPRFVSVVINAEAQLMRDDKPIDPKALAAEFKARAAKAPDTEVQLRADEKVPYGKVVEVIGLAQLAGLQRIGFVAQAEAAK